MNWLPKLLAQTAIMTSMTINLIHVSDIHFGSGESHGRLNPETGLNVRFEDFVAALTKVVDYSIEQQCDIFLFSGDAYRRKTSAESRNSFQS